MRRRRTGLLAGLAGVTMLLSVALTPTVQATVEPTAAQFTDAEYGAGSATALTLVPPTIVSTPVCVRPPALGGTVFSIQWQWPTTAPQNTFTAADVRWKVGAVDGVAVPTTGPDASGRYVSTFDAGLLGSLLGSLLGADVRVEMRTIAYQGWQSATVSAMTYNAPLVAGTPTCTIVNG